MLANLVRVVSSTVGTGAITLGAAVSGCLTFAGAGVPDGSVVSYGISDGVNSEVGRGTYNAGVLTRTTILASTNGGAAINLSGSEQVFITVLAQDIAVKASGAEIITGTDDAKFTTAKAISDAGLVPGSGWLPANAAWTYVSPTSFTTPGDQTAKFRIGVKIKCTIGGVVKYNYVTSSVYSGGVTTVNVKGNDLVSGTISENYFSLIAMPDGFPDVFAYTMIKVGFAVNTGTAYFSMIGRKLFLMIDTQGTSNANVQTLGLPFQVHLTIGVSVPARGLDNGAWLAAPSMAYLAAGDPTAINMCKVFDGVANTWTTTNLKGAVVDLTLLIG